MRIVLLLVMVPILNYSQKHAEYGNIPSGKNKYESYTTKAGNIVRVGDTIHIGTPSSDNGFNHITQLGQKAAVFLMDRKVVITKIKTFSDKRFAQRAYLCFKGYGLSLVDIDYELALKTGEIENPFSE